MRFARSSSRSSTRRLCAALVAAGVFFSIAWPRIARALEAEDRTRARALMAEGRTRRHRKDLSGALESFQAADSLVHAPTTALEVARTEIALGRLVDAEHTLQRMGLRVPSSNDPPPFARAVVVARTLSPEVVARIPTLSLSVTGALPGEVPQLRVDGVTLGESASPLQVDPGHHVVEVSVGDRAARKEIDVIERGRVALSLSLPPPPAPAVAPVETSPSTVGEVDSAPVPPSRSRRSHVLAWTGFAVAGTGIVAMGVTGILSISAASAARSGCTNGQCPPPTHGDLDRAHAFATAADVALAVSCAGAGVGLFDLLRPRHADASAAPASLVPWLGPTSAGVRGVF